MHRLWRGSQTTSHSLRKNHNAGVTIQCIQVAVDRFPDIIVTWPQLDDWGRSSLETNDRKGRNCFTYFGSRVERDFGRERCFGSYFDEACSLDQRSHSSSFGIGMMLKRLLASPTLREFCARADDIGTSFTWQPDNRRVRIRDFITRC